MTISLSLLLFALSNRLPPLFVGFREGQAPSRTSLQQVSSRAAASLCCLIKLTSMDLQMLQNLEDDEWYALYVNGICNTSASDAQTTASALQSMLHNDFGSNIHVGYIYNPTFATGSEIQIYAEAGLR